MLSEALGLELEDLSTLQRKLLIELMQRKHPRCWVKFASPKYGWQSQRQSLEEFVQNHQTELAEELAKAGLRNNGWKTTRRCKVHV
jgi:hypothetical protein